MTRRHSASASPCSRSTRFRPIRKSRTPRAATRARVRSTWPAATSTSPATSRTSSPSASRPTITRESGLLSLGTGSSVSSDSLVFRIKYAYAQFNLDDWMTKGSWTRIGIQQTPWVDFEEGIYRYRFQGTVFAERIPLPTAMTSSDAGVSFHYNLPSNYGDFHVGVYNGENYQKVEVNDQKALEFRGTLRPFATMAPVLRGLRAHLVYYNDNYAGSDERKRVMGNVTFEHQYLNAGFDYLSAKDQTLATATDASSKGYSIWATPRAPMANGSSWEGLHPGATICRERPRQCSRGHRGSGGRSSTTRNRIETIIGVAYWFPHQGNVSTAIHARLRRPELQQHHDGTPAQRPSRFTAWSIFKRRRSINETDAQCSCRLARRALPASPRRRCRSTGGRHVPDSDLFEVVRRVQQDALQRRASTTSRLARAPAFARSPRRRCSSARPTAR